MFYFNDLFEKYFDKFFKYLPKRKIIIIIDKSKNDTIINFNMIDEFVYEYYYEYNSQCNNYKIIIDSTKVQNNGLTITTNYINISNIHNFADSILGYHQRQNGFEAFNSHIEIISYNYKKYSSRGIFYKAKKIEYINDKNIIKLIIN